MNNLITSHDLCLSNSVKVKQSICKDIVWIPSQLQNVLVDIDQRKNHLVGTAQVTNCFPCYIMLFEIGFQTVPSSYVQQNLVEKLHKNFNSIWFFFFNVT